MLAPDRDLSDVLTAYPFINLETIAITQKGPLYHRPPSTVQQLLSLRAKVLSAPRVVLGQY